MKLQRQDLIYPDCDAQRAHVDVMWKIGEKGSCDTVFFYLDTSRARLAKPCGPVSVNLSPYLPLMGQSNRGIPLHPESLRWMCPRTSHRGTGKGHVRP